MSQRDFCQGVRRRGFLKSLAASGLAGLAWAGVGNSSSFQGLEAWGSDSKIDKLSGKLVWRLGLCAAAAYQPEAITDYPDWAKTQVELVGEPFDSPEGDLRGFVGRSGETVVVAFRGTVLTEQKNWKTDLDRGPVQLCAGSNCQVHRGFRDAYACLQPELEQRIREAGEAKQVVFVGHSLGGALALLAGQDYQDVFEAPLVVTFGQPRVGNRHLSQEFRGKLYRFINDFDPVPHVPVTGSYVQFGETVWFDPRQKITSKRAMAARLVIEGTGLIKELRQLRPDESLSDLAKRQGTAGGKKLVSSIKNHRLEGPTGYLACLARNANGEY